MESNNARVRLKLGSIEIEYEGTPNFLEDGLPNLIERVIDFYKANAEALPDEEQNSQTSDVAQFGKVISHSTNTIAAHMGGSSCTELALAAAAQLAFVAKKETFSRSDILSEMKEASSYYSSNMSSNLSKSLESLVKSKRLNLIKQGTYALSAGEKSALEAKLAQLG